MAAKLTLAQMNMLVRRMAESLMGFELTQEDAETLVEKLVVEVSKRVR